MGWRIDSDAGDVAARAGDGPVRRSASGPSWPAGRPGREVGARLWGWARERFGTPERFFRRAFVWNYCPLCFMEERGRNVTPDKLPRAERMPLFAACDDALAAVIARLRPVKVAGVGAFAARRAAPLAEAAGAGCGAAPHPSPASPAANRGWPEIFEAALRDIGIDLDSPPR